MHEYPPTYSGREGSRPPEHHLSRGGDVVYCVEHVCVQCPRRPAPGLQFRSPHRTECVRSTLDQTTAASRAGSRPGDGDGDGVQCRQEKLGGCFHSGGDDWRLLLGAAQQSDGSGRQGPFGLDGGMVKPEL
jgi:hypothetical protein